jgi:predicted transcriptional regulator
MVRLAQIMTADVFTVAPDSPVAEAAAAMVKRRFGSAVVCRARSWWGSSASATSCVRRHQVAISPVHPCPGG